MKIWYINRSLKNGRGKYLELLFDYIYNKGDYELEGEFDKISETFDRVKTFIHQKGEHTNSLLHNMQLSDLEDFGLDVYTVKRIGLLAFEYDRRSPKATLKKVPSFSNLISSTIVSEDSSINKYEDDDDFEEAETEQWHNNRQESRDFSPSPVVNRSRSRNNNYMAKTNGSAEVDTSEVSGSSKYSSDDIYEDDDDTEGAISPLRAFHNKQLALDPDTQFITPNQDSSMPLRLVMHLI